MASYPDTHVNDGRFSSAFRQQMCFHVKADGIILYNEWSFMDACLNWTWFAIIVPFFWWFYLWFCLMLLHLWFVCIYISACFVFFVANALFQTLRGCDQCLSPSIHPTYSTTLRFYVLIHFWLKANFWWNFWLKSFDIEMSSSNISPQRKSQFEAHCSASS